MDASHLAPLLWTLLRANEEQVPLVVPPQPWLLLQAAVDLEVFAALYASADSQLLACGAAGC